MRANWQVALIQTLETPDPHLRRRVFLVADEYGCRFGRELHRLITAWTRYMTSGAVYAATSAEGGRT